MSDSEITKAYSTIFKELYQAGFDSRIQQSAYRTTNNDGIISLLNLLMRKEHFPLFCKYKERVHWMGCDEYSDATDAFTNYQLPIIKSLKRKRRDLPIEKPATHQLCSKVFSLD